MHILILILQTVGKILLGILLFLLLLLLIILLVPLRYRIRLVRNTEVDPKPEAGVEVKWLAGLIRVIAEYKQKTGLSVVLKILWLKKRLKGDPPPEEYTGTDTADLSGGEEKQSNERVPAAKASEDTADHPAAENESSSSDPSPKENEGTSADLSHTENEGSSTDPSHTENEGSIRHETAAENEAETADRQVRHDHADDRKPDRIVKFGKSAAKQHKKAEEKKDRSKRAGSSVRKRAETVREKCLVFVSSIPEKIGNLIMLIFDVFDESLESLDRVNEKISRISDKAAPFLTEETRAWIWREKKRALRMLHHFRPRDAKGFAAYGTGKPDLTGSLTGILYLILPVKKDHFILEPDFYDTKLEMDVILKGHIRLCHTLVFVIATLLDRETWKLFMTIRKRRKKASGKNAAA